MALTVLPSCYRSMQTPCGPNTEAQDGLEEVSVTISIINDEEVRRMLVAGF